MRWLAGLYAPVRSILLGIGMVTLASGCGGEPDAAAAEVMQLQVDDAYVHPLIADRNVTVGYFEIMNHGERPITLVGASSEVAARLEIHTHIHDGDIVRMRPLRELELPVGERISFEPGGHHLMFLGVESMPARSVEVTLHFSDAPALTVPFQVRERL
jgi:periplasmic copper chaperone A